MGRRQRREPEPDDEQLPEQHVREADDWLDDAKRDRLAAAADRWLREHAEIEVGRGRQNSVAAQYAEAGILEDEERWPVSIVRLSKVGDLAAPVVGTLPALSPIPLDRQHFLRGVEDPNDPVRSTADAEGDAVEARDAAARQHGTPEQRFRDNVMELDGHLVWTGLKKRDGSGQFRVNGKQMLAHRFAFERHHGRPPGAGMAVRQRCGRRDCVTADCLFEQPKHAPLLASSQLFA